MSAHYMTYAPVAILGAFVVVAWKAFTSRTLGWVARGGRQREVAPPVSDLR
jgi:hypothetical protein